MTPYDEDIELLESGDAEDEEDAGVSSEPQESGSPGRSPPSARVSSWPSSVRGVRSRRTDRFRSTPRSRRI